MKLIDALKKIKEREKSKRRCEKEMRKQRIFPVNQLTAVRKDQIFKSPESVSVQELSGPKNTIHVQSIFPKRDISALKDKTGELHTKEAIRKAVFYFLTEARIEENFCYIPCRKYSLKENTEIATKGVEEIGYVHVQSMLLLENIIVLKEKTREKFVKEAIFKAVYFYLKYA